MFLDLCRDEATFSKSMMAALKESFHLDRDLTFAFIDSFAKHPMNLEDQQQQDAFAREADILWNFALNSKEFVFEVMAPIQ